MTVQTKERSNKSGQLVVELRQRLLEDYENNKDLYNEDDVNRIRNNEWYVKRFLLARRRNVNEAYDMMKNTMRWRQEFGLPVMKDIDFPLEFYKVGGLFPYERDLNGNVVIYLRIRMHRKIPEMADPLKKFLMHIVNKTDKEVDGNGMVIVFDCSGAGYSNMDIDFLTFLITTANSYFPVGLKYILVYELSWLLNAFRRIAMSLIPQSFIPLIKFANKSDITNYISNDCLPDFMGGTCRRNYRYIPDKCTNVAELAIQNGYTQEDIDRILPIFEPLLEEADKALAENTFYEPISCEKSIETNESNETKVVTNGPLIVTNKPLTHINSDVNEKSFSKMLGIFPNKSIHLTFESISKTFQSNIILQNLSETPIAYKIQSNNPNNYSVCPRLGIIMKGASLRCNIQLISGRSHCIRDKFLILTVPVSDHKLNAKQFTELWKDSHKTSSHKLITNISENNNSVNGLVEETKDLNEEMVYLRDWCKQLEKSQKRLSLLLYVMLFAIVLLLALVIYSHSYSEFLSLKSEIIRKFAPKTSSAIL